MTPIMTTADEILPLNFTQCGRYFSLNGQRILITTAHHASSLTSVLLSYPVPCSQKRIGSPT